MKFVILITFQLRRNCTCYSVEMKNMKDLNRELKMLKQFGVRLFPSELSSAHEQTDYKDGIIVMCNDN